MAVMKETLLQRRIQKLIRSKGGYVHKNWGNMTSEPGIADLTVCYKGMYIALEIKDRNNIPSPQQAIHCRLVRSAGGITAVLWSVEEAEKLFDLLDEYSAGEIREGYLDKEFKRLNIKDGTEW